MVSARALCGSANCEKKRRERISKNLKDHRTLGFEELARSLIISSPPLGTLRLPAAKHPSLQLCSGPSGWQSATYHLPRWHLPAHAPDGAGTVGRDLCMSATGEDALDAARYLRQLNSVVIHVSACACSYRHQLDSQPPLLSDRGRTVARHPPQAV